MSPDEKRLHGPPELVVEVLSPSTALRDKTEKFDLYETHGVGEYWIIDPRDKLVEVYGWSEMKLARVGGYTTTDTFSSPLLNAEAVPVPSFFAL